MATPQAGPPDYHFCPLCGAEITSSRSGRPHCAACGFVHYRNPVAGVAVVIQDDHGRVLLGERARGEWAGLWCIPCGFVEWDEDIREAAVREFEEETGLRVRLGDVFAVHSNFHNPKQHTVGTWFRGEVLGGVLHPQDGELLQLAYADPAEPPPLAFPTDALVLERLAEERMRTGHPGP